VSSLFVSASNLTRNSPIIFGLHDLPPAGKTKGRRGFEAPLNGLLVCSFALEPVKKVEEAMVRMLLHLFLILIITSNILLFLGEQMLTGKLLFI
jgi:hypothetical protein